MARSPVPADRPPLPALSIERELESAARYAALALAPATRRAYDHDWRVFAEWCVARGLQPMPAAPETVAAFLEAEADRELHPVTITKRAAAIAAAHRAQGQPSPCEASAIAAVLAGIRRTRGMRPTRKAQALELEPLARMIELIDTGTLAGLRDRALLLLGFAAALRRSELVGLERRGPAIRLGSRAAGHDPPLQDGSGWRGRARRGAVCPGPRTLRGALRAALSRRHRHRRRPGVPPDAPGRQAQHRRLSDQSVALIVKRRAEAAGVEAALLSGHSLRAGYATAAAAAGVEERQIANVTRHRSLPVLRGYIRAATAFDDVAELL